MDAGDNDALAAHCATLFLTAIATVDDVLDRFHDTYLLAVPCLDLSGLPNTGKI
jgi:hypothetical protein